jgi:hypothetical protein
LPVGSDVATAFSGAEGFRYEFEPVETRTREHVRGVGALFPGLSRPNTAALQSLSRSACGPGQQAVPELLRTEKPNQVRQVRLSRYPSMRADRSGRLAIGQVLPKLYDRHQRQPPGPARLTSGRVKRGKVLGLVKRAELVAQQHDHGTFGKGRAGQTDGFFRDRRDDVRVE